MPAPMRCERQRLLAGRSARSGRCPSRVCRIVKALRSQRCQHGGDRLDRCARQGQVVAHRIDVAALAAEVGLHVDDDQGRVGRPQVAVVGPGVGVRLDERLSHCRGLLCQPRPTIHCSAPELNSAGGADHGPGARNEVRIMMTSVST